VFCPLHYHTCTTGHCGIGRLLLVFSVLLTDSALSTAAVGAVPQCDADSGLEVGGGPALQPRPSFPP
jgi:hypothetical protein